MRFRIGIEFLESGIIPYNYNYQLSSAIYSLIEESSPEYSEFLHDKGYHAEKKIYKLFNFALKFSSVKPTPEGLKLIRKDATLLISAPVDIEFLRHILKGGLEKPLIKLTFGSKVHTLQIKSITVENPPEFTNSAYVKLLSPMVLSTGIETEGKFKQYYLRPEDVNMIGEKIAKNLVNKYMAIHNNAYGGNTSVRFEWDEEYLKQKSRITKKITIPTGINKIDVIGLQAPFYLTMDKQLFEVAFYTGFGEKNSMGCGFAEFFFPEAR